MPNLTDFSHLHKVDELRTTFVKSAQTKFTNSQVRFKTMRDYIFHFETKFANSNLFTACSSSRWVGASEGVTTPKVDSMDACSPKCDAYYSRFVRCLRFVCNYDHVQFYFLHLQLKNLLYLCKHFNSHFTTV